MTFNMTVGQKMDVEKMLVPKVTVVQQSDKDTVSNLGPHELMLLMNLEQKALKRANFALVVSFMIIVCFSCALLYHVTTVQGELDSLRAAVAKCSSEFEAEENSSMEQDFEEEDFEEAEVRIERAAEDSGKVKRQRGDSRKEKEPGTPRKWYSHRQLIAQVEKLKKMVGKGRKSSRKKREAQDHTVHKNIAAHLYGDAYRNVSRASLGDDEVRPTTDGGKITKYGYVAHATPHAEDVIKMWRQEDWVPNKPFEYSPASGTLKVKHKGVYVIYAQLLFFNANQQSGYTIMRKRNSSVEPLTKCLTGVPGPSHHRYRKTCTTMTMGELHEGDQLYLVALEYNMAIIQDKIQSHWGVFRLYSSH